MDNIIKSTAEELLESLQQDDKIKSDKLVDTINKHALIAVGAAWIPIPYVDLGMVVFNIWHMYVDINKILGISFKDNLLKSIGSAVVANISTGLAGNALLNLLKFIPGANIAAAVVLSATNYAMMVAAGWIYMTALERISSEGKLDSDNQPTKGDFVRIIKDNKEKMQEVNDKLKSDYIKEHKDDQK